MPDKADNMLKASLSSFGLPKALLFNQTIVSEVIKISLSDKFVNALDFKSANKLAIQKLEDIGQGKRKVNYRLRDAVFSRQRYWGEPFPVYYENGLPKIIESKYLEEVIYGKAKNN